MLQQPIDSSKGFDITYDRSERHYTVTDTDGSVVLTFPPKQKAEAVRYAISLSHPELAGLAARMAEKNPQLARVAWAGAEIVIRGGVAKVYAVPVNGCVAEVESSDGLGRYALAMKRMGQWPAGDTISCNCENYTSEQAPTYEGAGGEHRVCKHIAAYWLTRKLEIGE